MTLESGFWQQINIFKRMIGNTLAAADDAAAAAAAAAADDVEYSR